MALNCISLNSNGLHAKAKRKAVFEWLRKGKYDCILLQETHCTEDEEKLWSAEWGGNILFSNGRSNSRGVAALFQKGTDLTISTVFADEQGRLLILKIDKGQNSFVLANIYAPTQDQGADQLALIDTLEEEVCKAAPHNIIIGGDFNLCMSPHLDKNTTEARVPTCEPNRYRDRVSALCHSLSLFDVWRSLHPDAKSFSFRRGGYASRLDYWFASEHLFDSDTESSISPCPLSDHAAVSLKVGAKQAPRGPGLWRLDNSLLLQEEYVHTIRELIREVSETAPLENPCSQWEWLKFKAKAASIKFAKDKRSQNIAHEKALNARYLELTKQQDEGPTGSLGPSEDPGSLDELLSVERELREMELHKANAAIERARTKWALYGERPSKYFLNLEKVRARDRCITQLISEDGSVVTEQSSILAEEKHFFEELYTQPKPTLDHSSIQDLGLSEDQIPTISDLDRERLEQDYSPEELRKALGKLNKAKCPGSDGLTTEFFLKFWEQLGPHFCRSLQHSLDIGEMSVEQRRGVISLIPKKGSDRRFVRNWRPITLLNTDYKIFTKAVACRLQSCVKQVVHPNQTGFIANRDIGENIRTIQDVIDASQHSNSSGFILALDYRKAFDSLSWNAIFTLSSRRLKLLILAPPLSSR